MEEAAENRQNFVSSSNEEVSPLVPRDNDGYPRSMGNVVQSHLQSTQQIPQGSTAHHTSNFATMMHLLKGNIGTGILAMPTAVSNAGLMVGTIGIPILGIFCVHCMHLLVISSKALARRLNCTSLDYPTTAEKAFELGPERIKRFAPTARFLVNAMLIITQFGFCCVYFLFVSKSLYEVILNTHGSSINSMYIMAATLPIMMLLNFIPDLDRLSTASAFANVLQSVGLIVVLYYLIQAPYSSNLNVYTAPIEKFPLYFGTAMYAFEGIGVILFIENAMARPDDFGGLNGVLNTGMCIVAALYTAVGFYGYLKYGKDIKSSITFNLPQGYVSEIVRVVFAVAIFLSYPLQFQVPLSIIWPYMKNKLDLGRFSERKQFIMELSLRTLLVLITFVLACSIPLLHLVIALVGAFASSSLALIFPPIIELATIWNTNISRWTFRLILLKDVFIVTLGVIGSIIGTYVAVGEIVHCSRNPDDISCTV